jgi:hypothetical protein
MAKSIVFLNLADMHEDGLVKTSVQALSQKYPRYHWLYETFAGTNQIRIIDLFDLLQQQQTPFRITSLQSLLPMIHSLQQRLEIGRLCDRADKIMLGVHGRFGDTEHGFASMGWDQGSGVVGNYQEFARLLCSILSPDRAYRLSLIMCYGARARNYRRKHDGQLDEADLKSSFAYKFYRELCRERNVTMTARTGSVQFDRQTGRSLVQTEAATEADFDNYDLQQAPQTANITRQYQRLESSLGDSGRIQDLFDLQERVLPLTGRPDSQDEGLVYDYLALQDRVSRLQSRATESVGKYGKFVYRYDRETGRVQVIRKYDNSGNKVFEVLYDGTL